jgi:hypothetical protein
VLVNLLTTKTNLFSIKYKIFAFKYEPNHLFSFYISFFLSFCFSIFLSFYLSVFLSFCLSVFLSFYLYVFRSFCLSIFLSFSLSFCLLVITLNGIYFYMCLKCFAKSKIKRSKIKNMTNTTRQDLEIKITSRHF